LQGRYYKVNCEGEMNPSTITELRSAFGDRMQENVPLSGYTSARIGGPAEVLVFVRTADELAQAASKLWSLEIPFILLGGGSNVLVSDKGIHGAVIINRARLVKFHSQGENPSVEAESGATLNDLSQRAARLGLSGLEWSATVPGSLGGAIYGNAGAFDGDIAGNLISAELLHRKHGKETWNADKLEYGYRTSLLKREHPPVVVLSATMRLSHGQHEEIQKKMEIFSSQRRASQPAGASMGSMFKNPPGEKAGRLIEAAGLKGKRIGNAAISSRHANFFVNEGATKAEDVMGLIDLARQGVFKQTGIELDLEVELVGEW
jgi:UDP-N-acetylmuramate dehydrogenase